MHVPQLVTRPARPGFYPRPYNVCDGSGGYPVATSNGPEWTACGGCTACVARPSAPPATEAERAELVERGAATLARIGAAQGVDDDEPY